MSLEQRDRQYQQEIVKWVNSQYSILQEYPLEGEFTKAILSDEGKSIFKKAKMQNFIEHADTIKRHGDRVKVWRVTRTGRNVMEDAEGGRGLDMPCSCEGAGMHNTEGSPYIQCTKCGGRWMREELE